MHKEETWFLFFGLTVYIIGTTVAVEIRLLVGFVISCRIGCHEVLQQRLNLLKQRLRKFPVASASEVQKVIHVTTVDGAIGSDKPACVDVKEMHVRRQLRYFFCDSGIDCGDLMSQWIVKLPARWNALQTTTCCQYLSEN